MGQSEFSCHWAKAKKTVKNWYESFDQTEQSVKKKQRKKNAKEWKKRYKTGEEYMWSKQKEYIKQMSKPAQA